jgi:hypothetical protein
MPLTMMGNHAGWRDATAAEQVPASFGNERALQLEDV